MSNKKRVILLLISLMIFVSFSNISISYCQTKAFDCFVVSDLAKIFEDGYDCPSPKSAIDVFGIRNEYISAQCVIKANTNLMDVTAAISPLVHDDFTSSIPSNMIDWNFVGSVNVPDNTPNTLQKYVIRKAPAKFPDYLSEDKDISISEGSYKSIWLTIKIPKDANPGKYSGIIKISSNEGFDYLPIFLTVYPLTIPDKRHLDVTLWYSTGKFDLFHKTGEMYSEAFFDMLEKYAQNMVSHRQNVFEISLNPIIMKQDNSGNFTFDFSRFDRWAEIFWATGYMDMLETGFIGRFGKGGRNGNEIDLRDFNVLKESTGETIKIPGDEILPHFLPVFEAHLREKGWLEKTVFHIKDEPVNRHILSWKKQSEKVHKYAPSLKRIDAIGTVNFGKTLEVWVAKLNTLHGWYDVYKKAQEEGCELWYYTCMHPTNKYPNRFIDFPLIGTRALLWLNYRFGLTGYLHWGLNYWTDDPYKIMNAKSHGPGDDWIVYPKEDGLINSIRWEQMRNGLQDYEYLWLLEEKSKRIKEQAGESLWWFNPSQRGIEIATKVVKEMDDFTRDTEVLYNTKREVIDEILSLDKSPKLILQSNPTDGSDITFSPATIEYYGWTEPGTEIIVNNRKINVFPDGVFMDRTNITADNNRIKVTAKNSKGERTLIRSFNVVR